MMVEALFPMLDVDWYCRVHRVLRVCSDELDKRYCLLFPSLYIKRPKIGPIIQVRPNFPLIFFAFVVGGGCACQKFRIFRADNVL